MISDSLIRDLDNALAQSGQTVVLKRIFGIKNNQTEVSVNIRGFVRWLRTDGSGNIKVASGTVITSATQINEISWPGGLPNSPNDPRDPRWPRNGDRIIISGVMRNVDSCEPIYVDNVLVRMNVYVSGGGP